MSGRPNSIVWPKSKYASVGEWLTDLARQAGDQRVKPKPEPAPSPKPRAGGIDFGPYSLRQNEQPPKRRPW